VDGQERGKMIRICASQDCPKHGQSLTSSKPYRQTPEEREAQKKIKEANKQEAMIIDGLAHALINRVGKELDEFDLRLITCAFYDHVWHDHKKRLLKWFNLIPEQRQKGSPKDYDEPFKNYADGASRPALNQALMSMALVKPVELKARRLLSDLAKARMLDVKVIEANIKDSLKKPIKKDKEKPKEKVKSKSEKKTVKPRKK
jgi:hypothetical protein